MVFILTERKMKLKKNFRKKCYEKRVEGIDGTGSGVFKRR